MSGDTPPPGDIFDPEKIRSLIQLMDEHELSEIDLKQSGTRIRLRRGHQQEITPTVAPAPVAQPALPAIPMAGAPTSDSLAEIKSPMVGTFYSAPDPESSPFVKVGDHVSADTAVCIIEAMKVFNEIPAEVSGQIVATLVENGDPVEFGQPLFRVDVGN